MGRERLKEIEEGFRKDEQDYWKMRDELFKKYKGKWVAVHKGRVVACGDDMIELIQASLKEDGYAYTNKVGDEDKLRFKRRRVSFAYNTDYSPSALPQVRVKFSNYFRTASKVYDDVIPDTGADITCLPFDDCEQIDLYVSPYARGLSERYAQEGVREVLLYVGIVDINGLEYFSIIEPVQETERALGRDVLNQLTVTFRGKEGRTIFEE